MLSTALASLLQSSDVLSSYGSLLRSFGRPLSQRSALEPENIYISILATITLLWN